MGGQGQAHRPGTDTKDTLNSRIVPIIFVPGVMGTRLSINGASQDWDPDDPGEMLGWLVFSRRKNMNDIDFRRRAEPLTGLSGLESGNDPGNEINGRPRLRQIALDQTIPRPAARAQSSAVIKFYERRGWGEVVWSFYREILMDMEEQLNPKDSAGELRPVYAVGYDWRGSNRDSAQRLIRRVNEFLGRHPLAQQVIIVTHSMGGLVTRSALVQGLEPRARGVIHTVIPADGAVVAYRRFLTGARDEFQDGPLPFRAILGRTRLEYSLMQSVLRGPTELLPAEAYPDIFLRLAGGITNKSFTDLFAEYERQSPPGILYREGERANSEFGGTVTAGDVNNLRERFREAKIFTRSVATRSHPRTFLMFGRDRVNDVEVDFTKGTPTSDGSNMAPMVIRKVDGDATVPLASSRFDGASGPGRPLGRDGFSVEHAECFGNQDFRKGVIERIRKLLKP